MKILDILNVSLYFFGPVSCSPTEAGNKLASLQSRDERRIYVHRDEKIQEAIKRASPGTKIFVEEGTYAEQLTISTNGISLIGNAGGVKIVPPSTAVTNTCSGLAGPGTEAGICIQGKDVVLGPFPGQEHSKVLSVGKEVKGISVKGLTISNFTGANIAVVGARKTTISGNTLLNGPQYGMLSAGSYNTVAESNFISSKDLGLSFIALCMDNFDGAYAAKNKISSVVIGFCVQTNGEKIRDNEVSDSCVGTYVDPHIKGTQIHGNHFGKTSPICAQLGLPQFGIIIDGASNNEVRNNFIEGQSNGGTDLSLSQLRDGVTSFQMNGGLAGGLFIFDDECARCTSNPTPAISSYNVVRNNSFKGNDLDIAVYSNGTRNEFKKNICSTSNPKGLCSEKKGSHY